MKNFVFALIVTGAACSVLQVVFPWWIIAVVSFVVAIVFKQKPLSAFGAGFISVFIVWTTYAFILSSANNNLLATKVADLLKALTGNSVIGLYLITGLTGGLVSGFAAIAGAQLVQVKQ